VRQAVPACTELLCLLQQQHAFFKTSATEFLILRRQHRLQQSNTMVQIDHFEDFFDNFKQLLHSAPQNFQAVNDEQETDRFDKAWLDAKFNRSRTFGGLKTVLPGTATVESNFSWINWEKDEYQSWLSHSKTLIYNT
jgi:hypothetical protein